MTDTSDVLTLARDPSPLLEALRDLIEYLDSDAEEMVQDGVLRGDSPRGVWELSEDVR